MNEAIAITIGLTILIALFFTLYWACSAAVSDLEERLGRPLAFWEMLLLGLTFPYSLLLFIILPKRKS